MEIIAHRGASHDAPENTLAAVLRAWRDGADAVEIDVRLTRDGRLVAIHDATPERYGGPATAVAAMTLAELQSLDVGRWKDDAFAGERVPVLGDVLETVAAGRRLFIEMKCGPEAVPELRRVLQSSPVRPEQTVIIGLSRETVEAAKRALPAFEAAWVVQLGRDDRTGQWLPGVDDLVRQARAAGLDALDLGAADAIDGDYVARVHAAGLKFYVWTVNCEELARRLVRAGIDGITTDRPGWLRERLTINST